MDFWTNVIYAKLFPGENVVHQTLKNPLDGSVTKFLMIWKLNVNGLAPQINFKWT